MIEVNGVTKHYREKLAVNDLSFEVKPGQVTGFLGPIGSTSDPRCDCAPRRRSPPAGVTPTAWTPRLPTSSR